MRIFLIFLTLFTAACESPVRPIPPLTIPDSLLPKADPPAGPLAIDGFMVISFPEPYSPSDVALYAPLIRVTETSGHAVTVNRIELRIVDVGIPAMAGRCNTSKPVASGSSRELFASDGLSYEVAYEGLAASSGHDATILVDYTVNDTGALYQARASAAVEQGTYPKAGVRITTEPCSYR